MKVGDKVVRRSPPAGHNCYKQGDILLITETMDSRIRVCGCGLFVDSMWFSRVCNNTALTKEQ